jgi:hypothetical protein
LAGLHLAVVRKLVGALSPQLFYNEYGQSPAWPLAVPHELAAHDSPLSPQIDFPDLHPTGAAAFSEDHLHEFVFLLQAFVAHPIGAAALFYWENLFHLPQLLNIVEQFSSEVS